MTELTKRENVELDEIDIQRVTEFSETLIENGWVQYGITFLEELCDKKYVDSEDGF